MNWFLQLSIDIGTEVKYQNKMLDDMVSFTLEYAGPLAATAKKKKKKEEATFSVVWGWQGAIFACFMCRFMLWFDLLVRSH